MNIPAMIIDFEATDVSKEAEATQLGWRKVWFEGGLLTANTVINAPCSDSVICQPDRAISYGAMAVSHITPDDLEGALSHKDMIPLYLPKGEAYIIAHNADYDIQVAANAGVDVSQYKAICTQALARDLLPDLDSHSLGALTYAIDIDRAKSYCHNAHNAGYDVTFTLWLLEHLCAIGNITSMEQLYLASEAARIPKTFTFGKYYGQKITKVVFHDSGYLHWVIKNRTDLPELVEACKNVLLNKEASHG